MSEQRKPVVPPDSTGVLTQFVRTLRLVWRLLNDSRVSTLPKLIVPAAAVYVLSPIDLVPDVILGLGQLDDVGIVALAVALFVELCPRNVVEEHRRAIAAEAGLGSNRDENVIDGSYREVKDDEPPSRDR
ncbi:MAG: DUF1232 domain-containing protein [Chloroflexi bacterium]|nr:DUF1232 domain-containing protein [Chloroflexota bacterium]